MAAAMALPLPLPLLLFTIGQFLPPASCSPPSSYYCDWCPRQSTASLLPPAAADLGGTLGGEGACGYGTAMAAELVGGYAVAAAGAEFFRDGAGCGACYQLRCRDRRVCGDCGCVACGAPRPARCGSASSSRPASAASGCGPRRRCCRRTGGPGRRTTRGSGSPTSPCAPAAAPAARAPAPAMRSSDSRMTCWHARLLYIFFFGRAIACNLLHEFPCCRPISQI
ncbi:expansin-like A4 isoform X2 [Panicum miliaceum]|uniref:Expansin-like A4 isoform X2 n=1 Tax=Panicum miliaceum TaxID=4540 RepID=A0A3L6PFV5_PANMI|nr:expansin-like A4 isoform X2 [Panicum miliaceum]